MSALELNVTLGISSDVPAKYRMTPGGKRIETAPAITGGQPIRFDLRKAPHILISGTTGSGKSVAIHSMLADLLAEHSPESLGLVLIDPKRVELAEYAGLPHLCALVKDPAEAVGVLGWVLQQIRERFALMELQTQYNAAQGQQYSAAGRAQGQQGPSTSQNGPQNAAGRHGGQSGPCKDIGAVSEALWAGWQAMPGTAKQGRLMVVVIDELADLMLMGGRAQDGSVRGAERLLVQILAIGRAAGVHAVLATQRPSVDVVTGAIKANVPTRLCFALQNATDSRVALGVRGAEELNGSGDGLWLPAGARVAVRMQGAMVGGMAYA